MQLCDGACLFSATDRVGFQGAKHHSAQDASAVNVEIAQAQKAVPDGFARLLAHPISLSASAALVRIRIRVRGGIILAEANIAAEPAPGALLH